MLQAQTAGRSEDESREKKSENLSWHFSADINCSTSHFLCPHRRDSLYLVVIGTST